MCISVVVAEPYEHGPADYLVGYVPLARRGYKLVERGAYHVAANRHEITVTIRVGDEPYLRLKRRVSGGIDVLPRACEGSVRVYFSPHDVLFGSERAVSVSRVLVCDAKGELVAQPMAHALTCAARVADIDGATYIIAEKVLCEENRIAVTPVYYSALVGYESALGITIVTKPSLQDMIVELGSARANVYVLAGLHLYACAPGPFGHTSFRVPVAVEPKDVLLATDNQLTVARYTVLKPEIARVLGVAPTDYDDDYALVASTYIPASGR